MVWLWLGGAPAPVDGAPRTTSLPAVCGGPKVGGGGLGATAGEPEPKTIVWFGLGEFGGAAAAAAAAALAAGVPNIMVVLTAGAGAEAPAAATAGLPKTIV